MKATSSEAQAWDDETDNHPRLARLSGRDESGRILVALSPSDAPLPARIAFPAQRVDLDCAIEERRTVLVLFVDGDRAQPVVVGLLQPDGGSTDEEVEAPPESVREAPLQVEADADGKRVRLTAQDELVLRCGSATITLRRNGRVIVQGASIESHATGTHRIKGGQVRIN